MPASPNSLTPGTGPRPGHRPTRGVAGSPGRAGIGLRPNPALHDSTHRTVQPCPDGRRRRTRHRSAVAVRAGQRRTLAARAAGLATVPVYVRPATDSDEKAQVVEPVSEQIVENDQRKSLTDAQRARGIQQMLDAGVSVTKVAKIYRTTIQRDSQSVVPMIPICARKTLPNRVFRGFGALVRIGRSPLIPGHYR
jgi:hypothetical protein